MLGNTKLGALALVGALTGGRPAASQAPQPVPFLLTAIALDLSVDYGRGTISGTAMLTLRNTTDQPVRTIPLLLNRLMTVSQVKDRAGVSYPFEQRIVVFQDDSSRQVNAIRVRPGRAILPHESLSLSVRYGGILVGYTETGSLYIRDRVSRDFTIIREDAYAFPVIGVPSHRVNRATPRGSFSFTANITVPADLVVATGGERTESSPRDSLTTWSYRSTDSVPFLNIAIAPYRVVERPGARIFYFPADSSGARMVDAAIAAATERYTRWFGPLGPGPRLVVMEIPEGFGSQASLAAGILQTADAFRDRSQLPQSYHELSHLWNVPDLDQPSARWNEGLASFLQFRMAAELDRPVAWDSVTARRAASLLSRCAALPGCDSIPFARYGVVGMTDRSYPVGMLMFYALYQVMGAEAFDRAYRDFVQRYFKTGARTADLVAAFRGVDPRSERIFTEWLLTPRWYARLAAESLSQIVEDYRR
jgi:hypothetical protein